MPKRKTDSDMIEQALARLETTISDRYRANRSGADVYGADMDDADRYRAGRYAADRYAADQDRADRRDNHDTAIVPRDSSVGDGESLDRQRYKLSAQQHIRDRIAEPPVTAEEIIGTLASIMRGDITQLLDDSGQIDFKLIKERRLGHLLKSVSVTVHRTEATADKPAKVTRNTSVQLHSPQQAAVALARLAGMDRRRRRDQD